MPFVAMLVKYVGIIDSIVKLEYSKNTYPAALFAWSPSQIIDIIDTVTHLRGPVRHVEASPVVPGATPSDAY